MINFSFVVLYGQDLISSTLEPLSEFMPNSLQEVNTRSQHIMVFQNVPLYKVIQHWNYHILNTYNRSEYFTESYTLGSSLQLGVIKSRLM